MNILQENYYFIVGIMSRFILEKNHMLTDIVTKSFLNLKLQGDMNVMEENYSSIDSYNLKLQSIMSRFILEKPHAYRYCDKKFS